MSIPAPTEHDKPFKIKEVLTIYEAAMVYAGRHPYPHFFCIKDGSIEEHLKYLNLGISASLLRKRARAQRSWDIYCELVKRIEQGKIQPLKFAYDKGNRIDPRRPNIRLS
jgi:hypothetical protein